jgi:hypothetical protein
LSLAAVGKTVDEALKPITDAVKIPSGNVSRYFLPAVAGLIAEIPADLLATGLGAKLMKAAGAIVIEGLNNWTGIFGDVKEGAHIAASYLGVRAIDPTPEDLTAAVNALIAVKDAILTGRFEAIPAALQFKRPELTSYQFSQLGAALGRLFGAAPSPAAPPPAAGAPPAPIVPTAPKSEFV